MTDTAPGQVIGYSRVSVMEEIVTDRNPENPRLFPMTQIKNENRMVQEELQRGEACSRGW